MWSDDNRDGAAPNVAAFVRGAIVALIMFACAQSSPGADPTKTQTASPVRDEPPISVVVSIPPQATFVQRIGGDRVGVDVLVGPGQTPETYEPTPQQMARLASARVYFRIGVPFETALAPRLARGFRGLRIVDVCEGIDLLPVAEGHAAHEHRHAPASPRKGTTAHSDARDPHVWLDPRLVARQLAIISRTLSEFDPAHAALFERNREEFAAELNSLHRELVQLLAPYRGRRFYVYHPAFGYLAAAHGLIQVAVETGGREPTSRELTGLIERARADRVQVLYTQPQYTARGAQAMAEVLGARLVVLDDLAADYAANLRSIGRLLAAGFGASEAP